MLDEELQIKDLLVKLDVLTYALIEERKKSQSYLVRIKEYQDSLQKKETEVVELTKTKFSLQSHLTMELAKKNQTKKNDGYISSIISKIRERPVDQEYITELEEKINQQSFEIKDLRQRLMEEKERLIEEKMKPVIDTESREKLQALTNKYNIEKGDYEFKISNLKDELNREKKNRDVITKLKSELEEVHAECEMKKVENKAMKDQVSKLDKELAKAKIDLKDSTLNDRFFQVERIKDGIVKNKKVMTVIFRLIKASKTEKGRCECVFKRQKHGGTAKEDVVNLLDFNTFKINDKKKDYLDVSFMVS